MSSPTGQESSTSNPELAVNAGSTPQGAPTKDDPSVPFKVGNEALSGLDAATIDKTTPGTQNASGTSETRRGEDISFVQDPGEKGSVKGKTASESLVDSIEGGVHERGKAEHAKEIDDIIASGGEKKETKRTKPRWTDIHF